MHGRSTPRSTKHSSISSAGCVRHPVGLQRRPPAYRGRCSQHSLLDSFPDVNSTMHGLATVYLLSKTPADFVPLGGSTEQHFTEGVPVEMAACFRSDLNEEMH
ncbi:polyunsaturated fatty acid lipoxygenase ALOX15B-like [Pagrus major]|uniref:polyunsaturated fatty acid lipoxygenase ALOX15B-like n=1 Tax=Pagrus major TaxID=143350 RepID=UPI003CC890F2